MLLEGEGEFPVADLRGSDSLVQQAQDRACGERVVIDADFPVVRCVFELKVGQVDVNTELIGCSKIEDQAQIRFPDPDLFDLESGQRGELACGHDRSVTKTPRYRRPAGQLDSLGWSCLPRRGSSRIDPR
ncbi:hypothetical protein [Nocardia amamiensis]|uniref:hypothetical protein n=1 Tax=Nocardia amamiensis TaxID=404578 RepID=UPI0012F50AA2